MKKYLIYTSFLLAGLLLGWLIFSNSSNNETETEHKHSESEEQIWTCSMHPQIRQPEPGDCPICGMDLIPLEENSNENPLVFSMSDEAVKIANIQTTKIGETGNSENGIALSGKIKPDETASSSVVTHVSGRIEKLYVSYTGQSVAKGQKVAEIYSPQLISGQKELIEANKVKSSNPSLYNAAYNKLKNWKLNDNQIESILKSESIIETFSIYAQFSGVIKTKKVSVGDYLKEGEVLFDLQSLSKVWAVFDVYETDLANVKIGDPVEFTTTSYPDEKFTAKVNFIDPLINPSTRTISVRANIQNNNSKLKPDMFINGWVKGSPNQKATLLVPKSAVLWTGKRSVVYLKLPNQTVPSFEYRNIEIGEAIGDSYKVISGLESGDEVVTNGAFVIDASAQLNNQSSMMNQNLVNPNDNSTSSEIPDYVDQTDEKFKVQLNELLSTYYNLKDAFVNDKADLANSEAKNLLKSLEKVEMKLLKGDAHMYWMTQKNNIQLSGEKIANSNDINEQRNQFISMSNAMINSVKAFGVSNVSYEQYCPMADDNGAYWLSESNKVLNPYFGSSMLNCGEIKNEIK
ncbi:efflux RND transporter periplasmic adaptor subunit [Crocinitomix algicola]|uniref:efflux RND transporter periplasmic adaptor subunit n=1 Tax=Crocinitomix algicola TaxID=1740263 RepID=UPI000836B6C0|nr:efflux RND transporter periplasmic adaptor subunit [Crocinitomix algicola]